MSKSEPGKMFTSMAVWAALTIEIVKSQALTTAHLRFDKTLVRKLSNNGVRTGNNMHLNPCAVVLTVEPEIGRVLWAYHFQFLFRKRLMKLSRSESELCSRQLLPWMCLHLEIFGVFLPQGTAVSQR